MYFSSPGLIWDPEAPFSEASIGKSGAFIGIHIDNCAKGEPQEALI